MTFLGHVAGAYLAVQLVNTVDPSLNLDQASILIVGVMGGVIPDIDALFYKQVKNHHDSPLHIPLFWAAVFLVLFAMNYALGISLQKYIIAVFVGVFSHFFLDWYGGRIAGVKFLYPFSQKRYSLFPLQFDKGSIPLRDTLGREYNKFYASNKLLLISEITIVVAAITLFIVKLS